MHSGLAVAICAFTIWRCVGVGVDVRMEERMEESKGLD